MTKSYIGITGFSHIEEVEEVSKTLETLPGYYMFGFTCSNKRMADPKSFGKISPSINSLKKLVDAVPEGQLPMIHYFTPDIEDAGEDLVELFYYCKFTDRVGIQFNAFWPPIQQLRLFKVSHPKSIISISLPKKSLDFSNDAIISRLKTYEEIVDYVFINPSGGDSRAISLMKIIKKETKITPGISGGFSPKNVSERCSNIRKNTEGFSYCIDAQEKLRTNGNLDIEKARSYISAARFHYGA